MTGVAGNLFVFSLQGELGLIMIVTELTPGFFFVAVLTFLSQPSSMDVVFLVAADALIRGVAVFDDIHRNSFLLRWRFINLLEFLVVTTGTLNFKVPRLEFEVGQLVIKKLLVQQNDIGLSSLVFRMTPPALGLFDLLLETMKSFPLIDICRHLFVAVQTKPALGILAERFVAPFALVFVLGVPLNDFAGHDNMLD